MATTAGTDTADTEELLYMFRTMVTIREFEEAAGRKAERAEIPGPVHLYSGEEAVAVGVCAALEPGDAIVSTHRGHGHCIAKGADVRQMFAALLGRATGSCGGKGGSMHIADLDLGMLGANGIMGAGAPIATGAAFAAQYERTAGVTVCFSGDGATNQGAWHEALNLAAVLDLPVIFVIENNHYAVFTPQEQQTRAAHLVDRADPQRSAAAAGGDEGCCGAHREDLFSIASTASSISTTARSPARSDERGSSSVGDSITSA